MDIRQVRPEDLAGILEHNEAALPHVNSLTLAELEALVADAVSFPVAVDDAGTIAGFVLVLDEKSSYESPNYRYFIDRFDTFWYVDRIVVVEAFRRHGVGRQLYEHLGEAAKAPRICCEVNLDPPNPRSIAFHETIGFRGVGEQDAKGKRVLMMEWPLNQ